MVDSEVVAPANRGQQRCDDLLGDVVDTLTVRAHEMVVVLGVAGDVCRNVPFALEATRHPILYLLLERPIDGRAADRRVRSSDALVKLLRRERPFR